MRRKLSHNFRNHLKQNVWATEKGYVKRLHQKKRDVVVVRRRNTYWSKIFNFMAILSLFSFLFLSGASPDFYSWVIFIFRQKKNEIEQGAHKTCFIITKNTQKKLLAFAILCRDKADDVLKFHNFLWFLLFLKNSVKNKKEEKKFLPWWNFLFGVLNVGDGRCRRSNVATAETSRVWTSIHLAN